MKQIDNKKLCFYCLGCNKLEDENFNGVMRCRRIYAKQTRLAREMEGGTKEWQ